MSKFQKALETLKVEQTDRDARELQVRKAYRSLVEVSTTSESVCTPATPQRKRYLPTGQRSQWNTRNW